MTKEEYELIVSNNKRLDSEIQMIVENLGFLRYPESREEPMWWLTSSRFVVNHLNIVNTTAQLHDGYGDYSNYEFTFPLYYLWEDYFKLEKELEDKKEKAEIQKQKEKEVIKEAQERREYERLRIKYEK